MNVNKSELANILGKSERTLTTWQKAGLPISEKGKVGQSNQYDTVEVVAWLVQAEIEKLTKGDDDRIYDFNVERARLTHFQAEKAQIEAELLAGTSLPADEVEAVWADLVAACRAKVRAMPTKAAPIVAERESVPEIQAILLEYVDEALTELSHYEPSDID